MAKSRTKIARLSHRDENQMLCVIFVVGKRVGGVLLGKLFVAAFAPKWFLRRNRIFLSFLLSNELRYTHAGRRERRAMLISLPPHYSVGKGEDASGSADEANAAVRHQAFTEKATVSRA
jgi:hypothetical protein